MDIKIFSLFPEMFEGPLGSSLIGKAREKDILHIDVIFHVSADPDFIPGRTILPETGITG